jgi:hypothetical protein
MSLEKSDIELIDTLIAARMRQLHIPIAREGVIQAYNPADGTVRVTYGDTGSMFSDTPDRQIDHPFIPLLTPAHGRQAGPRGKERVIVIESQGGPVALLHHEDDDSPGAPVGEDWAVHRNSASAIDAYVKLTNDGSTQGDDAGGIQILAGGFAKIFTTNGWTFSFDDTGKKGIIASPGGLSITLDDNNGVMTLGSGDDPGSAEALIRASDLNSALSAQVNQLKTDLTTWAAAHLQGGSGATGPTALTAVTSTGSSKVQSA